MTTRVLVLGATGRAGSAVLSRLPADTFVTAVQRRSGDQTRLPATVAICRQVVLDITDKDRLRDATARVDVVVNAIRMRAAIAPTALIDLHQRLLDAVHADGPLLVTVGGAGALRLPDGRWFWQHPAFPVRTLPRGQAHARLRDHLESGAAAGRWAYLIPPPNFDPDGPATGRYTTWLPGGEEQAHTRRAVSYADYAAAVVDAVVHRWAGTHLVATR